MSVEVGEFHQNYRKNIKYGRTTTEYVGRSSHTNTGESGNLEILVQVIVKVDEPKVSNKKEGREPLLTK